MRTSLHGVPSSLGMISAPIFVTIAQHPIARTVLKIPLSTRKLFLRETGFLTHYFTDCFIRYCAEGCDGRPIVIVCSFPDGERPQTLSLSSPGIKAMFCRRHVEPRSLVFPAENISREAGMNL